MRKAAALLAFTGTACTSLQVQHAPTTSVMTEQKKHDVVLTLRSGQKVKLFEATLRGDSIVGYAEARPNAGSRERSVATADITQVAFRKFSVVRTVAAVGTMVLAVAIIASGGGGSSSGAGNSTCASSAVSPAPT
jgi:hypothetical protein